MMQTKPDIVKIFCTSFYLMSILKIIFIKIIDEAGEWRFLKIAHVMLIIREGV